MDDFDHLKLIGEGTFGKVELCRERSTGSLFALKTISKKSLPKVPTGLSITRLPLLSLSMPADQLASRAMRCHALDTVVVARALRQ